MISHSLSTRDKLTSAQEMYNCVSNGKALVRYFGSGNYYGEPIRSSWKTYYGMLETLVELRRNPNICVLCPLYREGDMQACCGGKVAGSQSFPEAALDELNEELRITANVSQFMLSCQQGTYNAFHKTSKTTKIYTVRVSECKQIDRFDPNFYGKIHRRGFDHLDKIVGIVPWGSFSECFQIVSRIPICTNPTIVDNITSIAIVSISKAVEMAQTADQKLNDRVTSRIKYNLVF